MMVNEKPIRGNSIRPDAQAFDEIKIVTVPRYKTSGLSGNEWRISARVDFMRNGAVKHSTTCRDVETAASFLSYYLAIAGEEGYAYFASEEKFCDQEGCHETGQFVFRVKEKVCVGWGNCGSKLETYSDRFRQFCENHKERGDSDMEDNDDNYELAVSYDLTDGDTKFVHSHEGDDNHELTDLKLIREALEGTQFRIASLRSSSYRHMAKGWLDDWGRENEAALDALPPACRARGGGRCVKCGLPVEKVRECYAIPHCYNCLPPPSELPAAIPTADERGRQ